jgi:hypothetical protein
MNAVPRIVVGVDGFESSKAALRWAIHQAKLTGAVVDAVTTWHIPPGSELVPAVDMPDYQDDALIIRGRGPAHRGQPGTRRPGRGPARFGRPVLRAPRALPCNTSAMASFTSASGLVS